MKKKVRKLKKNEKGITLVALVVTIVVLLILAGITIIYVFGENGVFKLAQEAKDKTDQAKNDEQDYFNNMGNTINEYLEGNGGTTNLPDQPEPEEPTIGDITDKIQDKNTIVEDKNGNPITIPGGFKVVPNGGTDNSKVDYTYNGDGTPAVQDGIVIEDEEGNQFVWIPVGDIKNKDGSTTTITLGRYTFNATNGTPTLHQAAYTAEKEDNYTQTVTIESYYQELTSNSGNTAAKNLGDFVNKTKANGGYYLGRYEASKGTDNKVKSQYDKEAWASITQPNAATEARNMYNSNYVESDLINSYSWDTAIVFIQKYSGNSNYANKNSVNTSRLNTGKAGDKVCNIHDMASNCWEWSTEHSTNTDSSYSSPCVGRGGNYYYSDSTTSSRYYYTTTSCNAYDSFRPLLFLKLS